MPECLLLRAVSCTYHPANPVFPHSDKYAAISAIKRYLSTNGWQARSLPRTPPVLSAEGLCTHNQAPDNTPACAWAIWALHRTAERKHAAKAQGTYWPGPGLLGPGSLLVRLLP